jgi:hypothetical protein
VKGPTQTTRLGILILYVIGLLVASRYSLGTWLPPASEKGLWFYSGLAAILLGSLLLSPFYTKPADAISNAVAAMVALLAINIWSPEKYEPFERTLWLVITVYAALVALAGTIAIAFKDSSAPSLQKLSKSLYVLCDKIGAPHYVFSAVFLFSLVAFHRGNPREYLVIGLAWAVFVVLRPLEVMTDICRRLADIWRSSPVGEYFGVVVGHETPGIVLLRHEPEKTAGLGDMLVVSADDGRPTLAAALDHVGFAEGRWLRAVYLPLAEDIRATLNDVDVGHNPLRAVLVRPDSEIAGTPAVAEAVGKVKQSMVGLVTVDSDISQVQFEIVRTDLDLAEGRLLEVNIGSGPVLYQVVNGITKEEIVQQKNSRGYIRGTAKKIGRWNAEDHRFNVAKWVPYPNTPIFLVDAISSTPKKEAVGHFPGTDYPVMVNVNQLVTHNTAILGILGAGKSFLSLELVERMIKEGVKVICLDLTNQYASELKPYYDEAREQAEIKVLQDLGPPGKTNFRKNVEEGGSVQQFKSKIGEVLRAFLGSGNKDKLVKIFNPAKFEVWRQDSKPFQDTASMAMLTPTEITRLFAEVVLDALQEQGMTDQARCCLVFEEAHSLIPEFTAIASEGDKAATNGTAKAILQGRKYGLGCVVITQRTANVTKTVLNQCNSVFALRVFDATGMDFLRNYIGADYASVLSTLEDRHAVFFGRASSCKNPVLIRLNDRASFLAVFRDGQKNEEAAG